jgi:hypothetical protein
MEAIIAGILGVVVAVSFICLLLVAPIWGFVEACSSRSRSGGGKAAWVLFLLIGWTFTAIVLALWPGSSQRFRRFVLGSTVAAVLSLVVGISTGLMKSVKQPTVTTESSETPASQDQES